MKIAIVCSSIIANGGSERAASNMAALLRGLEGTEVSVVSLCSSARQKPAFDFGPRISHLELPPLQSSLAAKAGWYLKATGRLRKELRRLGADVVFSIGHNVSVMLPMAAAKRVKTYACEHIAFQTIPPFSQRLMRLAYPRLSGIVALSETAARKLAPLNANVSVIPNSLSFPKYNKEYDPATRRIIMVGRLSAEKGYDRMVGIAKRLKPKFPQWHIDIYGDGPERPAIERMVSEAGVDDYVTLHGQVDNIAERYGEASLLMLTSYSEALPMAVIEANSAGLPAIGYENEGTSVLIDDGTTGFVIADGDEDAFVEKLGLMMADRELLERLNRNALALSRQFSPQEVAAKWKNLLNI